MGHKLQHLSYASVWHGKSRLTQVTQGSITETYGYSGTGDRVKKVTGSVTTIYLEGLWEETLGTGASVKTTYSFGGLPVAVRNSSAGTVTYLHGDHLGSLSVATNSSGGLVNRQEFDPWGAVRSGSLPQTSQNFTGQRLDATGLLYYNARYYDPTIGRFLSADTIVPGAGALTTWPSDLVASKAWGTTGSGPANPQELNRYSYTLNNPLKYTDPTGHWVWMAVGALIGGGIDLGVQLYQNGGNWEEVNWVQVGVSAASGALGVGLGTIATRVTTSVVARVVINAGGSAWIGAAAASTQNSLQDDRFAPTNVAQAAFVSGVLGGAGAVIGEGVERGITAYSRWRYNRAWSRATTRQRIMANSNAWVDYARRGPTLSALLVGTGNATGIVVSNSGGIIGPSLPQVSRRYRYHEPV